MDRNNIIFLSVGGGLALLLSIYFMAEYGLIGILFMLFMVALFAYIAYDKGLLQIKRDVSDANLEVDLVLGSSTAPVLVPKGSQPSPASASPSAPILPLPPKDEVFYIAKNDFTYKDAPAVCAAYGARLANYQDMESAYKEGADWCGHVWVEDGMALYPVQESTWEKNYKDDPEHTCGRPGINGGYFDRKMKFGVACYGQKPKISTEELDLMNEGIHGPIDKEFNNMVQKIKGEIDSIRIAPFKTKDWSMYDQALDNTTQAINQATSDVSNELSQISQKIKSSSLISNLASRVGALTASQ